MDFEKLRVLRVGSGIKIGNDDYFVDKLSADVVDQVKGIPIEVIEYWMKRRKDGKDFLLQVPRIDEKKYLQFYMAIKTGPKSWMFNKSKKDIKIEIM